MLPTTQVPVLMPTPIWIGMNGVEPADAAQKRRPLARREQPCGWRTAAHDEHVAREQIHDPLP